MGKNALLQFVTLDYIILKTYERLAEKMTDDGMLTQNPNHKFNNPYQFGGSELQFMDCHCDPCDPSQTQDVLGTDSLTRVLKN